jgi:arabinogalactan endo-1,4-beta-galactosidase
VYKDNGEVKNPYKIFKDKGTNLVRLRLWHNPSWTKTVYTPEGPLYNDIKDVEKAIRLSKEQGMQVLLNFHYSDIWADPGKQHIPAAWQGIRSVKDLQDSVYNYTKKTLQYLQNKNLLPEFVQLGNETNCGMMYTDAPSGFPPLNICDGAWANLGAIINSGIQAVKDVTATATVKTKIILHVADPKNLDWWFDGIMNKTTVTSFDIVGFSFYPLWHTTVPLDQISNQVSQIKNKTGKEVMILETAYPWTIEADDNYNNSFGKEPALTNFPKSKQGQREFMIALTQEVVEGGGIGVIYWEPAWISSPIKDLWGTGSSWENCTLFDFDGNTLESFDYQRSEYR